MAPIRCSVLAVLVSGALARDGPCPAGSLPEWDCGFKDGNFDKCDAIANVGQAASQNSHCEIPTPENGCDLKSYGKGLKWQSNKGTECCNCWVEKEASPSSSNPCPRGSVPGFECDKSNYRDCYTAVNTGAQATQNEHCQIAELGGGNCEIKINDTNGVFYWKSTSWTSSTPCCNCYQSKGFSLGEISEHTKSRRLRANAADESSALKAAAKAADESSMLKDSPCQPDSLPEWDCKFKDGNFDICNALVNTGQAASPNPHCEIPTPENGCTLKPVGGDGGLKWQSSKNITCCNCWLKKASAPSSSPCPQGSTPGFDCGSNYENCYKAANVGSEASQNPHCTVPVLGGSECVMKVDTSNGVFSWHHNGGGECCNCYKNKGFSLGQRSNQTKLRRLRANAGDESSMLQLPVDELVDHSEEL